MKTDDKTLIEALRILVNDIYCEDGVARKFEAGIVKAAQACHACPVAPSNPSN